MISMKILSNRLPLADDNPSENADISNEKGKNPRLKLMDFK